MLACSLRECSPFKGGPHLSVLICVMSSHRIPAGHTAAPTLAVAEKMADLIRADYMKT